MNQNESSLNNKNYSSNSTKHYQNEIESLKEEINSIKAINEKTKKNMQLELHSKLEPCEYKQEMIEQIKSENESLKRDISDHEAITLNLAEKYDYANNIIEDMENEINKLNQKISTQNDEINSYKDESALKNKVIEDIENRVNKLYKKISAQTDEINSYKDESVLKNEIIDELTSNIILLNSEKEEIILENETKTNEINRMNKLLADNDEYNSDLILKLKDYKNELKNKDLENEYLKNNNMVKKLLNPLSYAYLLFKSNRKEISVNLKLYKALKNSDNFDIGHYLRNNEDIKNSKWCKYFSPQLHYVCNGFNEKRDINKVNLKIESKQDLLNYIHSTNGHD
ncbi:MAG: hypothetical protein IJ287_04525 [Methanobrevibacter sp.]|nr:hypothetical protein [Methanobrevibacter sp.]